MNCLACLEKMGPVEAAGGAVCLDCCRARCKASFSHRCSCGRKRRARAVVTRLRSWTTCDRCLGTVPEKAARKLQEA